MSEQLRKSPHLRSSTISSASDHVHRSATMSSPIANMVSPLEEPSGRSSEQMQVVGVDTRDDREKWEGAYGFGDPQIFKRRETREISEDSLAEFGDLPAVRAMTVAPTKDTCDKMGPDTSSKPRMNDTWMTNAEIKRIYRSRSPLNRAGNSSSRSRSTSPAPAAKDGGSKKAHQTSMAQKQPLQNRTYTGAPQQPKTKVQNGQPRIKEKSAITGFCLKCFYADENSNGKGHEFIHCPLASGAAKSLAVMIMGRTVNAPVSRDPTTGQPGIRVCFHDSHVAKEEAFLCPLRKPYPSTGGDNHLKSTRLLGTDALVFFEEPCRTCKGSGRPDQAQGHAAIDCGQHTKEYWRWQDAMQEFGEIQDRAQHAYVAFESGRAVPVQPLLQRPKPADPSQPTGPRTIDKSAHLHPAHEANEFVHYQERSPVGAVEHRLSVQPREQHRSDTTSRRRGVEMELRPSRSERRSPNEIIDELLYEEKIAHPEVSWLDRSLAIQYRLRRHLMKDILEGDPSDGTPLTIPLLEILDAKIREAKHRDRTF